MSYFFELLKRGIEVEFAAREFVYHFQVAKMILRSEENYSEKPIHLDLNKTKINFI